MFMLQICDIRSVQSLQQAVQQTTIVGTCAWMAPEVRDNKCCPKNVAQYVEIVKTVWEQFLVTVSSI